MAAVDDAKTVIQMLSSKTLTNGQMLSVATKIAQSQGSLWFNPWDEIANPVEYAAWPTNEELAQFFLDTMRKYAKSLLYRVGRADSESSHAATAHSAGNAEADVI